MTIQEIVGYYVLLSTTIVYLLCRDFTYAKKYYGEE